MEYRVLLPYNLDLEGLVKENDTTLDIDYLKYLIHHILTGLSYISMENDEGFEGVENLYVGINTKNLLVDNKKHKKHINFLQKPLIKLIRKSRTRIHSIEERSVIYRSPKGYKVGEHPYMYKLSSHFHKSELKIDYIKSSKLIRKIIKKRTNLSSVVKHGKYKFLSKYFNKESLSIDFDKAFKLCNNRYKATKSYDKYLTESTQLLNIFNGIYSITCKKNTDGRIHTNITRIPSIYREYILYNNKRLVELDISNSIIYFFSIYINSILLKSNTIKSYINNIYINNNKSNLPLMLEEFVLSIDIKEVMLIKKSSVEGFFYESFIEIFEKSYSNTKMAYFYESEYNQVYRSAYFQKRKVVKSRLLKMIFGQNHFFETEQKIFSSKYPTIMKALRGFKKKYPHNYLSHFLLQFESHVVLNCISREFNKKYWRKKVPIYTIHDGFLVPKEYKKELKTIAENFLIKQFKFHPKIS